jgi:hypothetical protein
MVRPELHQSRRPADTLTRPVRQHFDSIAWRRRLDRDTDEAVAALRAVLDKAAASQDARRTVA